MAATDLPLTGRWRTTLSSSTHTSALVGHNLAAGQRGDKSLSIRQSAPTAPRARAWPLGARPRRRPAFPDPAQLAPAPTNGGTVVGEPAWATKRSVGHCA